MVKKVVKKKVSKKKTLSKSTPKANSGSLPKKSFLLGARNSLSGFVFFTILFLVSLLMYNVIEYDMYNQLFFLLSFLFGAVSLALLISLLIYFIYSKLRIKRK